MKLLNCEVQLLISTFQKKCYNGTCYNGTLTTFKPSGRYIPASVKRTSSHINHHCWICDLFILKDEESNQNSYENFSWQIIS